jgi:hypothetical protein
MSKTDHQVSLPSLFGPVVSVIGLVTKFFSACLVWLITGVLRIWHYAFAPWFGVRCRFEPSCSEYSVEAFKRFGVIKGSILTLYRVVRCHPLCEGGSDPVPERFGRENMGQR